MIKKLYKLLISFFLTIFILILSIFLLYRLVNRENFINKFGFDFYRVANTLSMEPKYKHLDLLVITKYDFDKIEIGDIITFKNVNSKGEVIYISHEVIQRFEENGIIAYRTKGINEERFDSKFVTESGIENTNIYVGKVVFHSRILGRLFSYITSLYGIINLFFTVIIIYMIKLSVNHKEKKVKVIIKT